MTWKIETTLNSGQAVWGGTNAERLAYTGDNPNVGDLGIESDGDKNKFEWRGSWVQTSSGDSTNTRLKADDTVKAESLYYVDQFTGTGTDLGDTPSLTMLALPYDILTFTKSAGVETNTIDLQFTINGGVINIDTLTGGETIAITAVNKDGDSLGNILLVNSAGAIVAGTGLVAGTYFLYLGR